MVLDDGPTAKESPKSKQASLASGLPIATSRAVGVGLHIPEDGKTASAFCTPFIILCMQRIRGLVEPTGDFCMAYGWQIS